MASPRGFRAFKRRPTLVGLAAKIMKMMNRMKMKSQVAKVTKVRMMKRMQMKRQVAKVTKVTKVRMTKVTRCMSERVKNCKVRLPCNETYICWPPAGGGMHWSCFTSSTILLVF